MSFALRMLLRDWRSGELRVLILAIIVAVSTVAGIGLFADRIQASILSEAGTLIAADRTVSGSQPLPDEWSTKASELGLATGYITSFQAVVLKDEALQLSSVKAVSDSYPLKGKVKIADSPFAASYEVDHGPKVGEIWLISRLFSILNLQIGDTVQVGNHSFIASKVLVSEPDSAGAFFGVQPKVMIHHQDVANTGVVQLGSRVSYRLLLAGKSSALSEMDDWLEPQLNEHFRIRNAEGGQSNVSEALARAESFLLLAGCLAVILAAVAVALASQRYAVRQIKAVALLKTLGLNPNQITRLYVTNIACIALVGISIGLIIGWLVHWGILTWLAEFFPPDVEFAGLRPIYTAILTGVVCLAAFAYPPIHALRSITPNRILQSQTSGELTSRTTIWLSGFVAVVGLVWWYSNDLLLTLALIIGASIALLIVMWIGWQLIKLSNAIGTNNGGMWRIGLANLKRHKRYNTMQLMVFGLALMLLFILILLRTSLIGEWQRSVPTDAPNHFVFNIFPDEVTGVNEWRAKHNIADTENWPMVRGRVISVNEQPMKALLNEDDEEAQTNGNAEQEPSGRSVEYRRELNLTWSEVGSEASTLVAGQNWTGNETELLVSIEQDWAENLGLVIGDQLAFSIGGLPLTAKVANIREVEWESLQPNFYIVFNKPLFGGTSATWITSFYLPSDNKAALSELLRQYPTLSLVEVDVILQQVQSIVAKVSMAIEFILGLVLAAGGLTLVAGILATLDVRIQESAVMRALGAPKRLVSGVLLIEFGMLGALAGFIGVAGAELTLWYLQSKIFELPFSPHYLLWLLGPLIGLFIIGGLGWLTTRHVSKVPPLNVLRQM